MKIRNVYPIDDDSSALGPWTVRNCQSADDDDVQPFEVFAVTDEPEGDLLARIPAGVHFPAVLVPGGEGGNPYWCIAEPEGELSSTLKAGRKAVASPEPPAQAATVHEADETDMQGRIAALVGHDPLVLIEHYRHLAAEAGKLKGTIARLEHERKVVQARVQLRILDSGEEKAVSKADLRARVDPEYLAFLQTVEDVTAQYEAANGAAWATKYQVDTVLEAMRLHRSEMWLIGSEDRANMTGAPMG